MIDLSMAVVLEDLLTVDSLSIGSFASLRMLRLLEVKPCCDYNVFLFDDTKD